MKLLEGRRKKFFGVYLTSQIFIMYDKSSVLVSSECFFEETANGDVATVYFLVKVGPVICKCFLQETKMLVCNVTNVYILYQIVYVASVKKYYIINIFVPNRLPKTVNFVSLGYCTSYVSFLDETSLLKITYFYRHDKIYDLTLANCTSTYSKGPLCNVSYVFLAKLFKII
jgi:hypothetical protein